MGRPRTRLFILLAAIGFNVTTNYIFLKMFGVAGSALASGIGWIFIWILAFRSTRKFA